MSSSAAQAAPKWTLVIHGGAGVIERERLTHEQDKEIRKALDQALEAGSRVLGQGGSSLDAVEAAVKVLEDDPNFNAGRGAVFTYEGRNELDAAIMDGRTRAAGAVARATRTRNPVSLARAVMEKSPHVFLSAEGADQFSIEQGLPQVDPSWFSTPERKRQLDEMKAKKVGWYDVDLKYGTVGAVAVDGNGHVAAATSTGGLTGKRWGRIGDSPVIGAGTYADDRACAISATGAGEYFIRLGVAHEICARVRLKGETPKQAADAVLAELGTLGGTGGVIVTGPGGNADWSFNTPGMYRAKATSDGVKKIAIYGDEG
ncbi:isoaspartyl peptidase/L-asparaginase family protein [Sphingomonas sp. LaA6.9]|uniref:isoaspartyl peptidase/L-asparaginase family protein n=1 Tax=Sphingomonas sp. LaA6.9 TaxID=2919914 RepID=UPI001F4F129F|nr:isoaspartyl peptidase/L-asparaginase [Sphingomonas sp. LaA6.9]MCJ8156279.1 isoaspartyl peptidase/L-asparaginase [Sphingomonas sp. LaA6.9]